MGSTLIIIGIAILALGVFLTAKRKMKEKKLLKTFYAFSETMNCNISEYDLWNNAVIGIDKKKNLLLFMKKLPDTEIKEHINLLEIKSCDVINTYKSPRIKKKYFYDKSDSRIAILFSYHESSKQGVVIEFYNSEHDGKDLADEFKLLEKWFYRIKIELMKEVAENNKEETVGTLR